MCCGNRVVQARKTASAEEWIVTFPDGSTVTKASEVSAKLAAARSPGATVAKR